MHTGGVPPASSHKENRSKQEAITASPAASRGPEEPEEMRQLRKAIDEERKKKFAILDEMRRYRRKLAYKIAEQEALKKILDMNKNNTKNIGYLRRKKERLEFRISTEAFTLESERELIRKKSEIDSELEEAIKRYRTKRKAEFVAGDIEEATKKIEESNASLHEIEKKLDVLYSDLRKQNGLERRKTYKKPVHEVKPAEVSLADIAVIKEKKGQMQKEDSD